MKSFVLVLSLLLSSAWIAQEKPLWEAGFGATDIRFNHYRGSSEKSNLLLPFPYFVYRGEKFRMDRNGIRGRLFNIDGVTLEISANASPPVDSDDNRLREGMPDLDPTFEFGPRLNVLLSEFDRGKLTLELPMRAVFATDFSGIDHEGWLLHPNLGLDLPHFYRDWNIGFKLGPVFSSREFHDYFYGVNQSFVTPTRSQYTTSSGYSGSAFIAGVSKRFPRFWVGGFIRYDNLTGSDITSSPLVDDEDSLMVGIAFAWVFAQSDKMVHVADE